MYLMTLFVALEKPYTEFVYFYLPIILILISNSTFFTLTALKIRRVQAEMARVIAKEDSQRHRNHLEQEKDKLETSPLFWKSRGFNAYKCQFLLLQIRSISASVPGDGRHLVYGDNILGNRWQFIYLLSNGSDEHHARTANLLFVCDEAKS